MAQAQPGDTVKVHYTGRLTDSTTFDSSRDGEPLTFTIGAGQVIPGFEQAVVGMQPGESRTTTIVADQAYGEHRDDLVLTIDRQDFPNDVDPMPGQQLQIVQPDGTAFIVTVADANEQSVTLDANHPLAGQDLTFDLELVEIV